MREAVAPGGQELVGAVVGDGGAVRVGCAVGLAEVTGEVTGEVTAVADLAAGPGPPAFDEGVDRGFQKFLVHGDHELHFAQEIDGKFVAAIGLGMTALPAEALHVHYSQAEYFHVGQGGFDSFQAMGLDDGDYQFHGI